mgnify:CR=1 FL=1
MLDKRSTQRSIILSSMYAAEKKAPISSYLMLRNDLQEMFSRRIRKLREDDLSKLLAPIDEAAADIVTATIRAIGAGGSIAVVEGDRSYVKVRNETAVQMLISPSFSINHLEGFLLPYDGVIETAGEINALLVHCAERKLSGVVLARAVSYDAAEEMLRLQRSNECTVIPATPTCNDASIINDVAACLGVVCNDRRALMNDPNDLPKLQMDFREGVMLIASDPAFKVNELVARMKNDLGKVSSPDVIDHLRKSITQLNSLSAEINIGPTTNGPIGIIKDHIECGLRLIMSARRLGVVEHNHQIFPLESILVAQKTLNGFLGIIKNSSIELTLDD